MRLRYWSSYLDTSDLDCTAARLAPALGERGHEVALVAAPVDAGCVNLNDVDRRAPSGEGLTVHRTTAERSGDPSEILAGASEATPDVELVEIGGPLSALALAATRRSKRPLVATVHRPLPNTTHEADDPDGELLQLAGSIAVDGEAIAGQLGAFLGDRTAEPQIVRPGLPLTEVAPGPRLLKRPRLLCAGPLTRESGFDVAIEALAVIRERFGSAELLIVGEGPEREALERQAADLGLEEVVEFRGAVDAASMPRIVNESSLVIVPARAPISWSAIAVLAGQLLRPVIAAASGGLDEVIEQHGSGLLVVPEDPKALAGAARRLLAEPGAAADLGRRGRVLARERFGWERFVDQIERLLTTAAETNVAVTPSNLAG